MDSSPQVGLGAAVNARASCGWEAAEVLLQGPGRGLLQGSGWDPGTLDDQLLLQQLHTPLLEGIQLSPLCLLHLVPYLLLGGFPGDVRILPG